jgi:hypothetical protein
MPTTARAGAVRLMVCSLALASCISTVNRLNAGDADPSVSAMLAGSNELMTDGQFVLSLANPVEQKQWPVLKSYLEVFLIGVDPKLPTRIEAVFGDKATRYIWSVPVSNFQNFNKNNLQAILTPRVRLMSPGVYKLGSGKKGDFNGALLSTPPYAHLVELADPQSASASFDTAIQELKQVPPNPAQVLKPLLDRKFILAFEVKNKKTDGGSQIKRRESFQSTRKEAVAGLKKEKGESAADFDLRKKAIEIQMDEAEWFFAESEYMLTGVTIDREKKTARGELELAPIADSELAKAVALLGTKASHFANIEKSAHPIFSFRLNHPLTEMRKKNLLAMAALIRDGAKARAEANDKLKPEEKEATGQLIEKTHGLFEAAIKGGLADGFIDVHKGSSGKDVLLSGFHSPDGTKALEIVNLLQKSGACTSVKLDVAEESGVKFHSAEFAKDKHPHWNDFVGAETAYIGVSKDAVWCAAGEGSLDALKAAIKKTTQPPPAGAEKAPWAELIVKVKPWVEQAAKEPPKRKGEDKYRKLALAALEEGDDQLLIRLTVQDKKIVGELSMQTGLLRFGGKAAADFSKENLDTDSGKKSK